MKHMIFSLTFLFAFSAKGQESSFEIYFLKDSSLTEPQIANMDINKLVLQEVAWLTKDNVQFYDYSSHCIYLKDEKDEKSRFFKSDTVKYFKFKPMLLNKPFVIVANGERCYVGSLRSAALGRVRFLIWMKWI